MNTLLKPAAEKDRFGPSLLPQTARGGICRIVLTADRSGARAQLRQTCPQAPGVYAWLDGNRRLLYVGKSKSLRQRLLSYFAKNPADPKMDRIRSASFAIVWEPIVHELLALIREQELIHRWRPEFNSMGQPIRMRPAFVAIAGKPAPNVRVAHRVSSRYSTAFGPITGTGRLKEAVDCLNQVFRLRDCSDQTKFNFGNQLTLFDEPANAACIRHELGSCPGPCAGLCSSAAYGRHLQAAVRFLEGESGGILRDLENAMTAAAAERKFETAASYRDRLSNLAWLDNRLAGLRLANQQLSGILPVESTNKRKSIWLVLRGGRIRETLAAPSTPLCMQTATAAINQIAREPDSLPTDLLDISLQLIVISWFRKNPSQLEKIIPFSAMSSCILSAAAVVPTTHTPPHSASPAPVGKP